MNLVIDRGNTQLKFGIFDKRQLKLSYSVDFLDKSAIKKLIEQHRITHAILSSVVDHKNDELCRNIAACVPHFTELTHQTALPFRWHYQTPSSIGKDRLAAMAGAIDLFPGENLLVFDAGTALTYELISRKGEFLGGNISPGMRMRFRALNEFTSRLPLLNPSPDNPVLGHSTEEAIIGGVQNSMQYELDGLIDHFKTLHPDLKVIITGGDAEFFARKLKNPIFVALNLVLFGLNRILEHNA